MQRKPADYAVPHMTMNDHWGFCADDENHKSTRTLIHKLARSAAVGGNYLLNVGPTPDGEILPVHAQRLREMGQWLANNSESIYGTRSGAIPGTADVVSTRKGDTHYIHALNYVSDCVTVDLPTDIETRHNVSLQDGIQVVIRQSQDKLTLTIPAEQRDAFDTVVRLEVLD